MDQTTQRIMATAGLTLNNKELLGYARINNPASNIAATTKSYNYITDYIPIVFIYFTPSYNSELLIYDTVTYSKSIPAGSTGYYLDVFSMNSSRTISLNFSSGTTRSVTLSSTTCGSNYQGHNNTIPGGSTSVSVSGWSYPGTCPGTASTTSTFSGGVIFNYSTSPTPTGTEISNTYKWSDVLSDSQTTLSTFNSSAYSNPNYYTYYVYPNYLGGKVYRATTSMSPPGNHDTNVTITWPSQYYL